MKREEPIRKYQIILIEIEYPFSAEICISSAIFANTCFEVIKMAKDSQLDPKQVRKEKSNGGPTMAESA